VSRTWAPVGMVPVLRRVSKRREVSSIVAVTPDGRLYARHVVGTIHGATVIQALRYFRRRIGTPLIVIWDRLNAHRAAVVQRFLVAHGGDFTVVLLPPYAPELNPEEQCNSVVKRELANALPDSIAELRALARRSFRRLQHRPTLIQHFFHHAGLHVEPAA
jgi:transposase